MDEPNLPSPVRAMVEAINAGDTDRFLGLFTEDGVVEDWGKVYAGRAAIKSWSERELIGARGVLTVRSAAAQGNTVTLIGDWKSSFYTGPGRFIFLFGRCARLELAHSRRERLAACLVCLPARKTFDWRR